MKKLIGLWLTGFLLTQTCAAETTGSIVYGSFGKINLYFPAKKPTSVALLVSGDGGWESGVVNMARKVADQGALVLGIDAAVYKKVISKTNGWLPLPCCGF